MRQFVKLSALVSLSFGVLCSAAFAQEDVKGAKDHPLFSRFPNSYATEYSKNFDSADFAVGKNDDGTDKRESLEGQITKIRYYYKSVETQPSPLEVIRNYQSAIKAIGGEVVYERKPTDMSGGETTLKTVANNKEFWVRVAPEIFSGPTQNYQLTILEREPMVQQITANKLLDELNTKGFVTLYINFDTNKWDIKNDSRPVIDEVSKMLTSAPDMKVRIEGHTDNVGTPESNLTLSTNRAQSVLQELMAKGVRADRLTATGFGQEKPVADNRTEDGRAKNRRVEIVKM